MFPSIISTFTIVSPTDRLNSPSHSALHNSLGSVLTQVQTVIGLSTSSAIGSLMYDVRSPSSNGGGHVQSANKGGTGQTTYTKGDILVATSSSVLSKLAAGADGFGLIYNSSLASGLGPGTLGTKVLNVASIISALAAVETSIFSTTISASILGTSGAIRSKTFVSNYNYPSGASVLLRAFYGGATIASVLLRPPTSNSASFVGMIGINLIANNSAVLQRGIMQVDLISRNIGTSDAPIPGSNSSIITGYNMNISSVNSSTSQTFGLTVLKVDPGDTLTIDASTIEKIT